MNWDSSERRKFVRIKFPCEITIRNPKKRIISANAENISAGGLRAILEEKLPISEIVSLDIYGICKEPIICTAKILWVFTRKLPCVENVSLYDTGMEFYDIKDAHVEKIKQLVAAIASDENPSK